MIFELANTLVQLVQYKAGDLNIMFNLWKREGDEKKTKTTSCFKFLGVSELMVQSLFVLAALDTVKKE